MAMLIRRGWITQHTVAGAAYYVLTRTLEPLNSKFCERINWPARG